MMKKYYYLLTGLIGCSNGLFAQSVYRSDSIQLYNASQEMIRLDQQSIALLNNSTLESYGYAGLQFKSSQGNYRRPQEAYTHQDVNFYTEGFNTVGRFKLQGSFLFDKVWEDSLANTFKGSDDDITPFYYFAGKAGKYERQNFKGNVLISYQLVPEKWMIGVGANYQTHWTTRSVDPRPEINEFQLQLRPQISYHFKKQAISLGAMWGYGDETTSIIYKNSNYNQSLLYPDRIHYTNQGYGFISIKDSTNQFKYNDFWGVNASYSANFENWKLRANYQFEHKYQEVSHDVIRARKDHSVKATFERNTHNADIWLQRHSTQATQSLWVNIARVTGKDWNSAFNAHSYDATLQTSTVNYEYLWSQDHKWQPALGATITHFLSQKSDLAAAHSLNVAFVQPQLNFNIFYNKAAAHSWKFGVQPYMRISLQNDLTVPITQENVFTKSVVYGDYYYYATNGVGIKGGIQYNNMTWLKKLGVGMFINGDFMKLQSLTTDVRNSTFTPTDNRCTVNGGVQIYL